MIPFLDTIVFVTFTVGWSVFWKVTLDFLWAVFGQQIIYHSMGVQHGR